MVLVPYKLIYFQWKPLPSTHTMHITIKSFIMIVKQGIKKTRLVHPSGASAHSAAGTFTSPCTQGSHQYTILHRALHFPYLHSERTNMRRPIDFSFERWIRKLRGHHSPGEFLVENLIPRLGTNDDQRNLHAITRGVISKFINVGGRNLCSLSPAAEMMLRGLFMRAAHANIYDRAPAKDINHAAPSFAYICALCSTFLPTSQIKCERASFLCFV